MARIRYESALKNEEDAYSKERDLTSNKGSKLSMGDQQTLSRLFEKAGESFIGAELSKEEQLSKAIGLYQKAYYYTQYPEVKKRIKHRIDILEAGKAQLSSSLEKKVQDKNLSGILSISFLAFALLFVSSTFTGNVIGGLSTNNSRLVGICLFACGLIFTFIYLRRKTKKIAKKK